MFLLTIFAGVPAITTFSSVKALFTKEVAPMMQPFGMMAPFEMRTFAPIQILLPIVTGLPGFRWAFVSRSYILWTSVDLISICLESRQFSPIEMLASRHMIYAPFTTVLLPIFTARFFPTIKMWPSRMTLSPMVRLQLLPLKTMRKSLAAKFFPIVRVLLDELRQKLM